MSIGRPEISDDGSDEDRSFDLEPQSSSSNQEGSSVGDSATAISSGIESVSVPDRYPMGVGSRMTSRIDSLLLQNVLRKAYIVQWVMFPRDLSMLLRQATKLVGFDKAHRTGEDKSHPPISGLEEEQLTQLAKEAVPVCFEKILGSNAVRNWTLEVQCDIFEACLALGDFTIALAKRFTAMSQLSSPEQVGGWDYQMEIEEILPVLYQLRECFSWHSEFAESNQSQDVPRKHEQANWQNAHPLRGERHLPAVISNDSQEAAAMDAPKLLGTRFRWQAYLVEAFVAHDGLLVLQSLTCAGRSSQPQSMALFEATLGVIAAAMTYLVAKQRGIILHWLTSSLLQELHQRLQETICDSNDRTSSNATSGLFGHLYAIYARASAEDGIKPQVKDVAEVQRHYIEQLVKAKKGLFARQLAALREVDSMLRHIEGLTGAEHDELLQETVAWLRNSEVLAALLAESLHQRQYADLVAKVLSRLAPSGGVSDADLDLLWGIAQKEDTFEAVKENVYNLLGNLAMALGPVQLDVLFSKFESCGAGGVAGDAYLTQLLNKLIESDTQATTQPKLADRLPDLLWHLVFPATSASDVSPMERPTSPAIPVPVQPKGGPTAVMQLLCAAVLKYDSVLVERRIDATYAVRCVTAIAGDNGTGVHAVAALQLLQLLAAEHMSRTEKMKSLKGRIWVEIATNLETKQHVTDVALKALLRFQAAEHARLQLAAQGDRPSSPMLAADDAAAQFHTAAVDEFAKFIQTQAQWLRMQLPWQLVDQIWDALCASPPYASDRAVGLGLLQAGTPGSTGHLLTCEDAAMLLTDRLPTLDPTLATENLVETHIALMIKVNQKSGKLRSQSDQGALTTTDIELTGMDYLWRLALEAPLDVHMSARNTLLTLHTLLAPPLMGSAAADIHTNFLRECARRLVDAAAAATSKASTAEEAQRASQSCTSCLQLLAQFLSASQGQAQPSQPAHGASFVGDHICINADIAEPSGGGKLRIPLESHANCYVGTIRKQLGNELRARGFTSIGKLRLFFGGKELRLDGVLLRDVRMIMTPDALSIMVVPVPPRPASVAAEQIPEPPTPPGQLLASLDNLQETLAALAQHAASADTRAAAVRLGEQLPTRQAETKAVHQALLLADNTAAAVAAALTPRNPSHLLYVLQVIVSFERPADISVPASRTATVRRALRRPDVLHSIIDAVSDIQSDTSSPTMLATIGQLVLSLLDRQLADARQAGSEAAQQHGKDSEGAVSMSVDTHSIAGATVETAPPSDTASRSDSRPGSRQLTVSQSPPQHQQQPMSVHEADPSATTAHAPRPHIPTSEDDVGAVWQLAFRFVAELASKASARWHTPAAERSAAFDAELLAERALQVLDKWLQAWPSLAAACLMQPGVGSSLIMCLLCPTALEPGRAAATLLTGTVVNIRGARAWLLNMLMSKQELARSRPQHCNVFYSVACTIAEGLSFQDPAQAAAGNQALRSLLASVPYMKGDSGPDDYRLQGQLRLLAALLIVLDGHGSTLPLPVAPAESLTAQLITDMLFPESAPAATKSGNVAAIDQPRCSSDGSRQAALDLLQVVMSRDAEALQEGAALLLRSHMDCLHFNGWHRSLSAAATRGPSGYVGLRNLGATCYANSVFQQLFMQPSIRSLLLSGPEDPAPSEGGVAPPTLYGQLQLIFAHLAAGKEDAYDPRAIFTTFRLEDLPVNVREHQDADEFFVRLQDVDTHLQKLAGRTAMKPVLGGKVCNQVIAPSVPFVSEREEDYCRLEVDVVGKGNLEAALAAFVKGDLLDGGNQYHCDQINAKVDAVRRTCIKTLPQLLVMQLKRFDFDFETLRRLKRKDYFSFPVEIDMLPYTAAGLAAAEAAAAAEKEGRVPPQPPSPQMYTLKGIIVHAGSAFAGHYYSYIQERGPNSKWHLYDDTSVEAWSIDNLEAECFGGKFWSDAYQQEYDRPSSAYMLFYERSDTDGGKAALDDQHGKQLNSGGLNSADMDVSSQGPATETVQGGAKIENPTSPPSTPEVPKQSVPITQSSPIDLNGVRPMDTSAPTEADVPSPDAKDNSSAGLPYSMPPGVWSHVAATNLRLQREQHCLAAPYFRFVADVVKAWLLRSSGSSGSGSSKMRRVGPEGGGAPDLLRSPAAKRRPEDTSLAIATAAQLGISFFLNVFCRSSQQLRDEAGPNSMSDWVSMLSALIGCDSAIASQFLSSCESEKWMTSHLQTSAPKQVRQAMVSLLDAACDSVYARTPHRAPVNAQGADAMVSQLVQQLCDNANEHLSATDPANLLDSTASSEACTALCKHSHATCGLLLGGQTGSFTMLGYLASLMDGPGERVTSEHLLAGVHLATLLLLSTEGPPFMDAEPTLTPNPYTVCPPGSTPHPWPLEFGTAQVAGMSSCMPHAMSLMEEQQQHTPGILSSFPERFFRLLCMVSWEHRANSVPVLNSALQFLDTAAPDTIHAAQSALLKLFTMEDSLKEQRLSYLFQPPQETMLTRSHRATPGLLLLLLQVLEQPRPHYQVGVALLRILHGLATSSPPQSFSQVHAVIRQAPDPGMRQQLLDVLCDLQSNIKLAQTRFNEPKFAADYAWIAEPGLTEMLDDCKALLSEGPWPSTADHPTPARSPTVASDAPQPP